MQIVIDIDEDLYKSIICHRYKIAFQQKCDYEDLKNAIEDGTPLPKGHGRLIDESQIDWLTESDGSKITFDKRIKNTSPTIIEAESEDKE